MSHKYIVSWLLNEKRHNASFENIKAALSFYWKLEDRGLRPSLHENGRSIVIHT